MRKDACTPGGLLLTEGELVLATEGDTGELGRQVLIERGLGASILPVLMAGLDDHLPGPWEEAFRMHLRRLAEKRAPGGGIVAVGPFWTAEADPGEIDAVVLAGRGREAVLVGEAKWTKRVDGPRLRRGLELKAQALPRLAKDVRYAVCAREAVEQADDLLAVTAEDIFGE